MGRERFEVQNPLREVGLSIMNTITQNLESLPGYQSKINLQREHDQYASSVWNISNGFGNPHLRGIGIMCLSNRGNIMRISQQRLSGRVSQSAVGFKYNQIH